MERTYFVKIFLGVVLGVWCYTSFLQEKGDDRFSSDRIVKAREEETVPSPPEDHERSSQTLELLKENGSVVFDYLGHGTQAVAFASRDGQFVIKFFLSKGIEGKKRKHFLSPLQFIPIYQKERKAKRAAKRLSRLKTALESYAFAFEHLREESGLISMHLHPTSHLFPPCIVRDRYGKAHEIDLDQTVFVLQKKTTLVPPYFAQIHHPDEYQKAVLALEQFFENRARKGIYEIRDDFPIEKNYGFLDGRLIFLDPGRIGYSKTIKESPNEEIERVKGRLHQWLANRFPPPKEEIR